MNWIAPRPSSPLPPVSQVDMQLAHGVDTVLFAQALRWQEESDKRWQASHDGLQQQIFDLKYGRLPPRGGEG